MKSFIARYKPIFLLPLWIGLLSSCALATQNQTAKLHYTLVIEKNHYDAFQVVIQVEHVDKNELIFRMPRWSPGAYRLRDYYENVRNFTAKDLRGHSLKVTRVEKDAWQVQTHNLPVMVNYEVQPAFEFWSGYALDSTYAIIQGPSVFMYIEGRKNEPIEITYKIPHGWQLVSPLPETNSSFTFHANNYDEFIDAPVFMGKFEYHKFKIQNVPFFVVLLGPVNFEISDFLDLIKRICKYQISLFNEIPFKKYVFFYRIQNQRRGGGGLEHLNSTVITLSSRRLEQNILNAAEVTAHEFFHAWNVKRIHPVGLGPFDYTKEVRTGNLWFSEGVTSYYAKLTLLRSHIWSLTKFLQEMADEIERLQETGERLFVSVQNVSRSIWERGYANPGLSYYNKGQILGWLLDLEVRRRTNNRVGLDDVMRFMNWWFAKENAGFAEGEIRRTLNALTQTDFTDFFENYVAGTAELPYEEILSSAGFNVSIESEWVPSIGDLLFLGPRNRVVLVEKGSPAEASGLRRGDLLIKIDDQLITSRSQFFDYIQQKKIGDIIKLKIRRDEIEKDLKVKIGRQQIVSCEIDPMSKLSKIQKVIFDGWLNGQTCLNPSHN